MTGAGVEIELALDPEPPAVNVPEDFARALDADPAARAAYHRLTHSRKGEHVRAIESAKTPETRKRRIEKGLETLTAPESLTDPRAARRSADVRVAASEQVGAVPAEPLANRQRQGRCACFPWAITAVNAWNRVAVTTHMLPANTKPG